MQPVCAAQNLIQIKYPFIIKLVGKKSHNKRPGSFFFKVWQFFVQIDHHNQFPGLFSIVYIYTHIIQQCKELIFGLNLELHRFDAFLRLEATVQLYIEVAGKILGWSFTFGVRSVENCYKKGTLKNLTTPIEYSLMKNPKIEQKFTETLAQTKKR